MIFNRKAWLQLLAGVLLLVVAMAAARGLNNYQLQVGSSLAMLCTLCLAWNVVGGYMGYPSFATATFFGLGAYGAAIAQTYGAPLMVAWLVAATSTGVIAGAFGAALLRLKGHYFAIGTIATVEVFREIANNWDSLTGGAVGLNLPIVAGGPDAVGRLFYFSLLTLAFVAFLVTLAIANSRFGFGLRCIRQNEQAAAMVGVEVYIYKVAAFILSAILCGAAGGIYATMVGFIEPKDAFSILMTIEVAVMVMLGGMGTVFGPLIGALFYVVLREYVWANFISWHSGILGVIVVVAILALPNGVLGWRLPKLFRAREHAKGSKA
jgi:branched-chain amino acid transport system permease protein